MRTIYLVSCAKKKKPGKHPAKDIYISTLFKKARACVEQRLQPTDAWFILSGKYGILCPDDVIKPYDKTLNKMNKKERQIWAENVLDSLASIITKTDKVVILAGKPYREFLHGKLLAMCQHVEIPLEGMRIGEQLHLLGKCPHV